MKWPTPVSCRSVVSLPMTKSVMRKLFIRLTAVSRTDLQIRGFVHGRLSPTYVRGTKPYRKCRKLWVTRRCLERQWKDTRWICVRPVRWDLGGDIPSHQPSLWRLCYPFPGFVNQSTLSILHTQHLNSDLSGLKPGNKYHQGPCPCQAVYDNWMQSFGSGHSRIKPH